MNADGSTCVSRDALHLASLVLLLSAMPLRRTALVALLALACLFCIITPADATMIDIKSCAVYVLYAMQGEAAKQRALRCDCAASPAVAC
jgi:hypothetical protein